MTLRPKLPIRQLFLGYKDLWQTIADLQQGLRGSGQLLQIGFLIQMRRIVRALPFYERHTVFQMHTKKYTIAKSDISKGLLKFLLDEWILPW